ncbi:hypothetical protein QG034_04885 [Kingella kingae]|uniref:protein YgfX n=1 Tax=Kingella kingae TaxID=504 RepID=UPI00254FF3FE|nr:protein YgfX [Kingella kingae]MDK4526301.1 hypothetical protein [Kingella kingae]MDK4532280.1 hypothetical protein [Kingella kingae]MDK4536806.1 hypothetical protein [Kingella kingae]MDK4538127.1 hypothetical protein [Kingella kingae]MDK4546561.1 hypothetical protein [Kingella kingae]
MAGRRSAGIIIAIKRSKLYDVLWIGLCAMQAACVWLYFAGGLRWLLLCLTFMTGAWAWRQQRQTAQRVHTIQLHDDGVARLFIAHESCQARLGAGCLFVPRVAIVHWQLDNGRSVRQFLLPDSLNADDWRKLFVWATWAQKE